jgi:uncharacterized membrane protein
VPKVENSVWVNAPVETVMSVARDYAAYPEMMQDVKSLTVLEDDGKRIVAKWVARAEQVKMDIRWTQEDVWDLPNRTSHFRQVSGDYDRLEGDWNFTEENGGTRFDSVVDIEFNIPLVGPLIKSLIARLVKANLDATLNGIKNRAEQIAGR